MPLRTRISGDLSRLGFGSFFYDSGGSTATYSYPGPWTYVPSNFSTIADVVGNQQGFNPVEHLVVRTSSSLQLVPFNHVDGARIRPIWYPIPLDPTVGDIYGLIPKSDVALLSQWSTEAYNAFTDQVPTEVSLANFIYELRDIKGMIPKIERSVSKTASSNFLAFEFGVKPFVSDVKKIMSLASSVQKRLNHLRATVGQQQSLHFSRDIPPQGDISKTVAFTGGAWNPGANIIFKRVGYSGTFHASAKLLQNLEGLNDDLSNIKAFAAATGFNNPAAIVWEAIPYSFVADWLFRFDQQIGRLAIQPFGGEWSLSNVGWSINQSFIFDVYQAFYLDHGNVETLIGRIDVRRYVRYPGLPVSSIFLTDGELTPKQLALSLALLNQRR